MNRKGSLTIAGALITLILIAGIIAIISFVFSDVLRLVLIGVAILVGVFILFWQTLKSPNPITNKQWAFLIGIGAIGLIFILSAGFIQQTVLGQSRVQIGPDGEPFWVVNVVATNINEETYAFNYAPSDDTLPDGSTIQPQDSLTLYFSKGDSYCEYFLQKQTKEYLLKPDFSYDILQNPSKKVSVNVRDEAGTVKTLFGGSTSSKMFFDPDGQGSATITTVGILGQEKNCPNYENVAIIYDGGNAKIVNKGELENELDQSFSLTTIGIFQYFYTNTDISVNTQFIDSFEGSPVVSGGSVKGDVNLLGNPQFTITADADYYDSIIITPPEQSDPVVEKINIFGDVGQGETGAMEVQYGNNGAESTISVSIESPSNVEVIPNTENFGLPESGTSRTYQVRGGQDTGCGDIKVTACSINQFGSNNCDSKTENVCIVEEGDNQFDEADFGEEEEEEEEALPECEFWEEYKVVEEEQFFGLRKIDKSGCTTASWVWFVGILGTIILSSTIIGLLVRKPRSKRRKKR